MHNETSGAPDFSGSQDRGAEPEIIAESTEELIDLIDGEVEAEDMTPDEQALPALEARAGAAAVEGKAFAAASEAQEAADAVRHDVGHTLSTFPPEKWDQDVDSVEDSE